MTTSHSLLVVDEDVVELDELVVELELSELHEGVEEQLLFLL